MNYRHAYHAGNFCDVLKHAVLALVIEHLKAKPAPFRVVDTHAGAGLYDLTGVEAGKTIEWRQGIGRLIGPDTEPLPEEIRALLAPYLAAIAALNGAGGIVRYPGSPALAQALLRTDDRLVAVELHEADAAELAHHLGRDHRAKVLRLDGWQALKALLPPKERRGVVLIDPPYEQPGELERVATGLKEALRRFATGTYVVWYPIKEAAVITSLKAAVAGLAPGRALAAELAVARPQPSGPLAACGVLVVNPPWTLAAALEPLLAFLADRLRQGQGGYARLEALGEPAMTAAKHLGRP